jgi:hypothetical protein
MPKYFLFVLSYWESRGRKNCLIPSDSSRSIRPSCGRTNYAQNDGRFKERTLVHEQVPNTNIKFICPEFKEKMLLREGRRSMNFPPTPDQVLMTFGSVGRSWTNLFSLPLGVHDILPCSFSRGAMGIALT